MKDAVCIFRINARPEFSTMINTPSASLFADFTRSVRSSTASIASIAFATRIAMTCCNWTPSAQERSSLGGEGR